MAARRGCGRLIAAPIVMVLAGSAFGTSSGLNNIPTADTPPDKTVVIQTYTNQRHGGHDDYAAGFKVGLQPFGQRLEFGLDGRLGEGDEGPIVLQAKYAVQPWKELPAFAIGVANFGFNSSDRDRAGDEFTFAVMSQDFGLFRAHLGYGFQTDNNAAFFGVDKTFKVLERDLMLRADCIQIDSENQWLASAGLLYVLHKNFVVESWVSQPLDRGDPIFTLKFNFIMQF